MKRLLLAIAIAFAGAANVKAAPDALVTTLVSQAPGLRADVLLLAPPARPRRGRQRYGIGACDRASRRVLRQPRSSPRPRPPRPELGMSGGAFGDRAEVDRYDPRRQRDFRVLPRQELAFEFSVS